MPQRQPFPCRLFIFDLDGTLIDSRADITRSVNLALVQMKLSPIRPARIAEFVGNGVQVLIQRALRESTRGEPKSSLVESTVTKYLEAYEAHLLDSTDLYAGVREALHSLRWANRAVITNKPERFSRRILEALGVADCFCAILGGDSTPLRKPDPAPLQLVMAQCGVTPRQTVMVGDSMVDIQAGKAAGAFTCGIAGGFRPRAELEAAGCDVIVDGLAGLPPYFRPAD